MRNMIARIAAGTATAGIIALGAGALWNGATSTASDPWDSHTTGITVASDPWDSKTTGITASDPWD